MKIEEMIKIDKRILAAECIKNAQARIDNLPYQSIFPYPYCCLCFTQLTADNIFIENETCWDVCIDCKDK